MKMPIYITLFLLVALNSVYAQVGIGTTSPNGALDVTSTTDGLIIPRVALSATNVATVITPTISELVYNTFTSAVGPNQVTPGFYYWDGSLWNKLAVGNTNNDWTLTGNTGTSSTTNFLGTTDDVDLVFKRNNLRAGYIGNSAYDINFDFIDGNTSFGANSILNPTFNFATQSGVRNTAFGVNVMPGLTSGRLNTGIGEFALFSNTSGITNTAIGSGSLFTNSTGNNNVAIGRQSLTSSNSDNNTAVGFASLRLNASGTNNTAIGYEALRGVLGSGNVGVGYQAGRLETGSNKLYIENSNANANNALIYGDFGTSPKILRTNGQLQIGNPTVTGYAFPTSRGTIGQILQTDGAGATSWVTAATDWSITGNSGLSSSTNFLGTIDNVDVAFRRNNTAAGRITNTSTSFGISAMAGTTTNNAAFGNFAAASTTGSRNVAIGSSSLQSNTIGDENVAIGNQALLSNTNSLRNTAVGHRAMATLDGSANVDNVAIGWQAMQDAASGIGSTFVGVKAGRNTIGNFSTAIGKEALGSNNGGPSSGIDNTAIGYQALSFNTTGQQNTAVGKEAMATTTVASNSTAIGYGALRNFEGAQNTAVGYQAGLGTGAGSSGVNNIFMGYQAGFKVTSGSSNVMIGQSAGNNVTTGTSNVLLGKFAGDNITSGDVNTFIGQDAGNLNTTGSFNIGIGPNSGNANTIGSSNINIGYQAGNSNLGNNNVNIGQQAGFLNTLGGNVNIGYQAGVAETAANKLYITNSATTPTTSLIYGDFSGTRILRTNSTFQIGDPAGTGYVFPIARGTVNQILQTDASGVMSWASPSSFETDPQVASTTTNNIPKWNGTSLVDGIITDNGTNVTVSGNTITTNFQMTNGATNNYFLKSDASGNGSWATIPVNTILPYTTTGAATGIYFIALTEYSIRVFNGVSEVRLPTAVGNTGKVFIVIGSNGIGAKTFSTSGGIIYDDVNNSTITNINPNERYTVQSDGTDWIVIGR